jgi:hypothetical protein
MLECVNAGMGSREVLKFEPASLEASAFAMPTADKTPSQGSSKVLKLGRSEGVRECGNA